MSNYINNYLHSGPLAVPARRLAGYKNFAECQYYKQVCLR